MGSGLSKVFSRANFQGVELFANDLGTSALFTKSAPYRTTDNEDAVLYSELDCGATVLAVADGVGGQRGGVEAANIAMTELHDALKATEKLDDLTGKIIASIESANLRIRELGIGAGSTIIVASISAYDVRFYAVGDSAGFVIGGKGKIKYRTIEHSEVGFAVEAGLIDAEKALEQRNRNVILNALGYDDMRIELSPPVKLSIRDTVFIASDGVLDNLTPAQISNEMIRGPVQQRVKRVVAVVEEFIASGDKNAKEDDLSIALYSPRL